MAFIHKDFEVIETAEFGIYGAIISDAIRRILALLKAYRVYGHYPYHIGSQAFNRVKLRDYGHERKGIGKYAGIHLIHHHPVGRRNNIACLLLGWAARPE
jgi:hypothetical protein